jgi:BirA family biotin operon repressor/biotin-[acetyl-CoA-carboxylase] ligase
MAAEPDQLQWVVLGIGVNVNARPEDFPPELRDIATSILIERGEPVPRALFAAALLAGLEEWLDRHASDGFGPIRDAWRAMSDTLGREVRVRGGGDEVIGTAEDLDATGALLVRGEQGVQRVVTGDVEELRTR